VKYADDLLLLAKGETVIQSITERLIDIGRCCGMEMNVEETKNLKRVTPSTDYDKSETSRECGIFQLFG
jgi:hypothetical protein